MKHPTFHEGWQTSSHLYFGGLEPLPKIFLDLGQQILSDSRLDLFLPLQKRTFRNSHNVAVTPSERFEWSVLAVPKPERSHQPNSLIKSRKVLVGSLTTPPPKERSQLPIRVFATISGIVSGCDHPAASTAIAMCAKGILSSLIRICGNI